MKKLTLAIFVCAALAACATAPEKKSTPTNQQSIERAEKSFQELDKEAE